MVASIRKALGCRRIILILSRFKEGMTAGRHDKTVKSLVFSSTQLDQP